MPKRKITFAELKEELKPYNKFPEILVENIRFSYITPYKTKAEQKKAITKIINTYADYLKEMKAKYQSDKKRGKKPMFRGLSVSETKIKRMEAYNKAYAYVKQEI